VLHKGAAALISDDEKGGGGVRGSGIKTGSEPKTTPWRRDNQESVNEGQGRLKGGGITVKKKKKSSISGITQKRGEMRSDEGEGSGSALTLSIGISKNGVNTWSKQLR